MNSFEQIGILAQIANVAFSEKNIGAIFDKNMKPNVSLLSSNGKTVRLINWEAHTHNEKIHSDQSNWGPEIRNGRPSSKRTLSDEAKSKLKEGPTELSFTAETHEEALSELFDKATQPGHVIEKFYTDHDYSWGGSSSSEEASYSQWKDGKWQPVKRIYGKGFEAV